MLQVTYQVVHVFEFKKNNVAPFGLYLYLKHSYRRYMFRLTYIPYNIYAEIIYYLSDFIFSKFWRKIFKTDEIQK